MPAVTPAKVQNLGTASGNGSTVVLTLSGINPTVVGNVAKVYVRTGGGAHLSSVADSKGNTWTVNAHGTSANVNSAVATTVITTSLANGDTITVTPSSTQPNTIFGAAEFSGVAQSAAGIAVVDQAVNGHFTSSPITLATSSTTGLLDLVLSAVADSIVTGVTTVGATDADSSGTWAQLGSVNNGVGGAYEIAPNAASNFSVGWTAGGAPANVDACVVALGAGLGITTAASNIPNGTVGTAYSKNLSAQGGSGTRTWTITGGTLPAGLSISGSTISGTPTTNGTSSFNIHVADTGGNVAILPVSITIGSSFSITTTSPLTAGTLGTSYGPVALASSGGTGTVTWSLQAGSGSLPPGLKLTGSTSTSSLVGSTFAATNNLGPQYTFWKNNIYTDQYCKCYYTFDNGIVTPASLADAQPAIRWAVTNNIGVYLCYHTTAWGSSTDTNWPGTGNKPTKAIMDSDQAALLTSIQKHIDIGVNLKGVVLNQELDGSKPYIAGQPSFTLTGDQATYQYYYHYKAIKTAHPTLDVCICYVDAASSATPSVRAGFFPGPSQLQPTGWGPKQANGIGKCYVDGILVDAYCDTYINVAAHHAYSATPATAPGYADIADYNGIKFGWGEAGNSATGGLGGSTQLIAVQNMTKYLSTTTVNGNPGDATNSIPGVMGYRITNNFPNLPVMWYENGGVGNTGSNNITDPSDYRISMLSGIASLMSTSVGGQISGKPTSSTGSPYSFTIVATDSTGATATKAFTLSISGSVATLAWDTTSPLPAMTLGVMNSFQFANEGGTQPYTYSITGGTLPPGITLTDPVNGLLSGTPTTAGTYSFTVHVVDSTSPTPQTLTQSFSMTILPLTVTGTPYLAGSASAPAASPLTLDIPITTEVQAGDFLQVGVLATAAQTITVADTAGNTYSLNTPGTGTNPDTTETGARLYVFEVDGSLALSPIPSDPSDPSSQPDSIQVTYSSTASAQAAIAVGDNGPSFADKMIVAHGSGTAVATGSTGTLSQIEEHAIAFIADTSTGGVPTWGAAFSSNVLDTEAGAATAFLSAAYKTVTASTALNAQATIVSAPWTAAITTFGVAAPSLVVTLADGVEGDPYSQTFAPVGGIGPFTYSIASGALPSGLTLTSGVISGTPTTFGTFAFTIQVTDTNGVSATSPQTITILSNVPSSAPSTPLPGNLLAPASSDFESGVGGWVNDANASSITTSVNASVTGNASLTWSATAAGATSVHSGTFPAVPSKPYVVSGYIMPAGLRDTQIGINWYDNTSTLIAQQLGPDNPSDTISWQPVQAALTAPVGAVTGRVVALVQESNPGDVTHLDAVFVAQSGVQVLIDWTNQPFTSDSDGSAGDDFMDVSPWVRLDQNLTYTRGRQDMISEIQAGSASFFLQNDGGEFTRFKSSSLPQVIGGLVDLQRRTQINLADDDGNWWTRFDGNISEINYTFDTTGNTSLAQISVTDVLSYLGRASEFNCWTKEQVLADGPLWHWTLDDGGSAGGAGVFSESSGNNGPALRLMSSDNSKTATIAFQNTTGGVETLADAVLPAKLDGSEYWSAGNVQPSSQIRGLDSGTIGPYATPLSNVYLTPKLTAQSLQNQFVGNRGFQLQAELPTPITPNVVGDDYAAEVWFTMDPAIATGVLSNYGPYTVLSLGTSREGNCIVASIYPTGTSTLVFHVQLFNQPPGFLGKNWPGTAPPTAVANISVPLNTGAGTNGMDNVQIPHHLVINFQGDPAAPVVTFALDGVLQPGLFTLNEQQYFDTICLGGAFGGTGCHFGGLSLASIYPQQLSESQIATHCSLGQYGMWESTTDDCISSLSNFANVPDYWNNTQAAHNGLSLTDYQDITGFTPLSAMETFESAEHGLLFVAANGSLNFHTRDWRMGYGAPDLLLPPDTYTADLGYQVVDQFMQNEAAIASQIYTAGASYVNQSSVDTYGPYAVNTPQAPAQLPLITFSRAEGQLGLPSFGLEADPNLSDAAQWEANAFGDPYLLPTSVTIDLLTLDPTSGLEIADLYALEIDNVVAPSGTLPASFPDENLSTEWFIEGVTETIGVSERKIQFYCSPAEAQRAWLPGDPTYGVLGTTARVGVSAVDLNPTQADGKDVSHDGGEPFWPPTFGLGMNNPSGNGHSFVGSLDMRGLVQPVSRILNPPMCVVSTISQIQTIGAASNAQPQIFWDTVHVDTEGGMGLVPGWSNWYVCTVPGFYDIDASLVWSQSGSGGNSGNMGQAWIVVAQKAAQAVAAGTGNPQTAPQYVCPVGESPRWNGVSMNAVDNPTNRIYLGFGDMVTLAAEQNTSGNINTGTNLNGSHMSILFRGYGTDDDGCQFNSSINGGTVTDKPTVTTFIKTYSNKHTYTYWGGGANYGRRSQDGTANQGSPPGSGNGSQATQITFPFSTINSDLNPGTGVVSIKSCSLNATNIVAGRPSGCYAMLGWWNGTAGQDQFRAHGVGHDDVFDEFFATGATKTFAIPTSFASAFQSGNATMLILGNSQSTRNNDYGQWDGGPGSWLLTIEYTVTV